MPETKLNIGSPITGFLTQSLSQIEKGLAQKGYEMCSSQEAHIKLNLTATETKDKHGNIILKIIDVGIKKSEESGQRIEIYARKKEGDIEHTLKLNKIREEAEAIESGKNSYLAKSGL